MQFAGRDEEIQKENDEVLGWTLDASVRGVAVMGTAVFVSSDLLRLAKEAAGCLDSGEECTGSIVMVVGRLSAFLMPLIGSIIDRTKYRRAVGSLSAGFISFTILLQMFMMEAFWFVAAILQIIVDFSYSVHLCAVDAYLPELTSNHEKLAKYTTQFSASQYMGSVVFLFLMVEILSAMNKYDRICSSLVSQTLVFLICISFFGYAWTRFFRSRPASQKIPANKILFSTGFGFFFSGDYDEAVSHGATMAIDEGCCIPSTVSSKEGMEAAIGDCYEQFTEDTTCHH